MATRRKDRYRSEKITISFDPASTAATLGVPAKLYTVPAGRKLRVTRVMYNNPTGLAANVSNFYLIEILNAALQAFAWSTSTAGQGTLTANTPVEFVKNATDANAVLPAGTALSYNATLTGAATLPAGRVVIEADLI